MREVWRLRRTRTQWRLCSSILYASCLTDLPHGARALPLCLHLFYQRDACRDLDGRDILHNRVRVEIRSPRRLSSVWSCDVILRFAGWG